MNVSDALGGRESGDTSTAAGPAHAAVALARQFGLPVAALDAEIPRAILDEIPAHFARSRCVLPLGYAGEQLRVAMASPTNTETEQLLQFLTGRSLRIEVAAEDLLVAKIDACYERIDDSQDFAALEASTESESAGERHELEALSSTRPVVRLVNNILLEAIRRHASDVHVRPGEKDVELVFRIDGQLTLIRRFSRALLPAIVGRIKILGVMDITEHRLPQDGQLRVRDHGRTIDIRISIMPSVEGPSVAMRLLLSRVGTNDVGEIGLSAADQRQLGDALERSHGMLLVTGPTGSGKSTTLYAALNAVVRRNLNIITVENPVEFHIPGITQIPINADIGMTFAKALRNILRHDPDVIMVGEIRDEETARIAVESAQTGHLLLSTLHTNSAVATVSRLLEMGIPAYLLRATLLGVLAQRLVRRNCVYCRMPEAPDPHVRELLGVAPGDVFLRGAGCRHCAGTGIAGRRMTYEYLVATPALRRLITADLDEAALQEQALRDGMVALTAHAVGLARQHEIPLHEAYLTRLE